MLSTARCLGEKNAIVPNAGTMYVDARNTPEHRMLLYRRILTEVHPRRGLIRGGTALCISHTPILITFFQKGLIFNGLGGFLVIFISFLKKD
jgi:hypothetical protein